MRAFDHSRLPAVGPVFTGESSHSYRIIPRSFIVTTDGFRWVNGGQCKMGSRLLLPWPGALVMINSCWRDPPRARPATSLVRTLQSLGAAVPVDGFHLFLQHLGNLLRRVCPDDNSRRTLLNSHDSSYPPP